MPEDSPRHCPGCSAVLGHPKRLVCEDCWKSLPRALQDGFNRAPTLPDRRQAFRAILDHFRERREQPELKLL